MQLGQSQWDKYHILELALRGNPVHPKLANIILGCYLLCALAAARTGERSRIASSALHTTNVDGAAAILHRRVSSALAGRVQLNLFLISFIKFILIRYVNKK